MRASISLRPNLLCCLATVALLGACASTGGTGPAPGTSSPCGADCKRVTLAMASAANLSGAIDLGNTPNIDPLQRITATTTKRIDCALGTAPVFGKDWTVTWGPVVVLKPNLPSSPSAANPQEMQIAATLVPANTMFVAKKNGASVYAIGIAGTNPASLFDWSDEDLDAYPVPWPGTYKVQEIFITRGTLTGLGILQGMQSNGTTLQAYLQGIATQKATIYISGHSLGGALAPALGLWLAESQSDWDPASNTTLQVYSFAGATPGDKKFAKRVHNSFPGGEGNNDMVIVDNSLDVVPHAFNLGTLKELDTLYLEDPATCTTTSTDLICIYPTQQEKDAIQKAIDGAQKAADKYYIHFATLGEGDQVQGITGTLKSKTDLAGGLDCPLLKTAVEKHADDYALEAIYQHVCAYSLALGDTTLTPSLTACRQEFPNG
jgi:hypothetical protein